MIDIPLVLRKDEDDRFVGLVVLGGLVHAKYLSKSITPVVTV